MYLTACGYQGTESGMIDAVQNIANTSPASNRYFAAIPGSSGFNTVNDCGACVEITNGGTTIIATIIDECPTDNGQNPLCAQAGHLDLSYGAWQALGYSTGDPSGTTWKFVSCPVTGNVTARIKSGNPDQVYLQNTVLPITAVTYGGQPANHLSYGVWQLPNGAAAAGATLVLTDVEGHTVTVTVPSGGGDTGRQFPNRCP
jgi:expansin (peptidoglycan-binding protein)